MSGNVAIAIIAPVQPEDFYDQVWEGVWEATFDLAAFGVQVENLTTQQRDVDRQRQILEELLGTGIAAIGIAPAHTSALDDLIGEHERQGTRVITFQGDAPGSARSAFVGADARRSGTLAGEVLTKLMRGPGHVVTIPGDQQESQFAGRYAGFRAELERHGACIQETRLEESGDALCAVLKDICPAVDGIYFGTEDLWDEAEVLEHNHSRIPCVGFGNTPLGRRMLQAGLISAVVDESRYQQGYFAVQKAYEATIKREGLESVFVPSTVAFSANAAELQQSLNDAFELLLRQRTEALVSYKARLEQANAELLNLSITDPLTGLSNRRYFETTLAQEVVRARRHGAMSLFMIDVNRFKHVNDTYGHQVGDEVLKTIARVLPSCGRNTDTYARLGGDEFAIILPHTDAVEAAVVRSRLMGCMARACVTAGDHRIAIEVSIGVATLPGDADYVDDLIAVADADMYRVKQASRALS